MPKTINCIIVDDEPVAREILEQHLAKVEGINVFALCKNALEAFNMISTQKIDLIFLDIQLTDGLSFDIFKSVKVEKPIIFTTAFNEYAIDAFKVNSIDYLLKPITYEDFSQSLEKLKNLKQNLVTENSTIDYSLLSQLLKNPENKHYKNRFMIKVGEHLKSIPSEDIAMFYAEGRNVSLVTTAGRQYIVDFILEELQNMLDPAVYFRVSRTFIVNINAIKDVIIYSSSRLKILLEHEFEKEIIVSREKVADFKNWFDGER